ncbi:AraC family transcriptional regulator [Flavobacterium salilacus subsp. salilacus]|uniref:helix-turn-helix domain-containing protein n=1 Tax=Flavobacterium TaxID=237 RepID=UPI001074D9DB|nr:MULTISPECIES: helix-turn-helix domain-containing protein [Flavobacterium]KAF2518440.1 AraC family transcriptional regulator [Flavobacterium salilacus subsp. salilacus]MBE1615078.1 AraC family transcriptional regulator [Flavobacterium sp. SaA2.13]
MNLTFKDNKTNADFRIIDGNEEFDRLFFTRDRKDKLLTIAWNRGSAQKIMIDEAEYDFPANSILPLMVNQTFRFENAKDIVAWQFNRDFYCIIDHDKEVSCVGFIFYGSSQMMFIQLDEKEQDKITSLLQIFEDEFETTDTIQGEMLRLLLVRLIITITRLAKQQYIAPENEDDTKFNLYREYNIMVEQNYRTHHDVQFYAAALNKSPKTLANVFALYGKKTPLQIIQERVITEAKRLMYYTDKSMKEIAAETGFEDTSHFSRFFKKQTSTTPTEFKNTIKK